MSNVEYSIYEVYEYFEKEIKELRETLKNEVLAGKMEPEKAREKYDMYLSAHIYLHVCLKMAESESYLGDKTFSTLHLYAKKDRDSSGTNKLKKALDNL
jgi:succinate dehydrogenase/fumarate reductase-like Fe-S protein